MLPHKWFSTFGGDQGPFESLMKVMHPLSRKYLQATPTPTHFNSASKVRVVWENLGVPNPRLKAPTQRP